MQKTLSKRPVRWTSLALALGGGTLFGTCEMRVRDAVVDASKQTFISLFDPAILIDLFDPGTDSDP